MMWMAARLTLASAMMARKDTPAKPYSANKRSAESRIRCLVLVLERRIHTNALIICMKSGLKSRER
jgi:hypothetical protein